MCIFSKFPKNEIEIKILCKKRKMTYLNIYPDIFQKIGEFLESDDLFSMALTCKSAYRAFRRPDIQARISFPLVKPKRLTLDQRDVIREMEAMKIPVKLICGIMGSGKSVVSLAYALRNNFDKIFLVVPPNLISMWEKTCKEFFNLTPLVLHNSNSRYKPRMEILRDSPPEEKIILISYKIFGHYSAPWLHNREKVDICIIDEAHHIVQFDTHFREILGLSATAFKKNSVSLGIKNLLANYNMEINNIIFNLDKTVIANKLPPVYNLEGHSWKLKEDAVQYILAKNTETLEGENDLRNVKWIPEFLSHPFIKDLDKVYLGGSISVGKKSFRINQGSYLLGRDIELEFKEKYKGDIVDPLAPDDTQRQILKTYEKAFRKFREEKCENTINEMIRRNIKYRQCLSICEYIRQRKEKAIIFDVNVTYLPFLFKYLIDRGIKAYMFSTHYDVSSRQKQLEKFKNEKDAVVLISSIAMLGEGHNITEANHIISLSTFLDENKYYQAIGRCHRYPQSKPVYVHHLFNSAFDKAIYEHSLGKVNLSEMDWEKLLRS